MLVLRVAIDMFVAIVRRAICANFTNSLENSGDRARAPMDLRLLKAPTRPMALGFSLTFGCMKGLEMKRGVNGSSPPAGTARDQRA
jgi:hypothetical protein